MRDFKRHAFIERFRSAALRLAARSVGGRAFFTARRVFFIVALTLDRATKYWALSGLSSYRPKQAFLSLGLRFNRGISFSLLENHSRLSLAAALTAIGLLALLCAKNKTARSAPGMTLLWAGAAGNLMDRLLYGYVIDWIFVFRGYINLADVWLCAGGLAVLIHKIWGAAPYPAGDESPDPVNRQSGDEAIR
ncbi:MAG: signal peptidase II [Synergistaceae bacterium]|jgi:signal peptidase II|nr:signal peptidase II [Synergistaceae bacterium]